MSTTLRTASVSIGDQQEVAELDDQLHVQAGRRAPYTMVGDWVLLADIPSQAKALYWALSAHLNTERVKDGDMRVWPTQQMLAEMIGVGRGDRLKPYEEALVSIGAINVRTFRYANGMRRRKVYTVYQSPAAEHVGHRSLADFYAARKASED